MARIGIDLDGVSYDFAASLRQYLHLGPPIGTSAADDCRWCQHNYPNPTRWEFYLDWGLSEELFVQKCRDGVKAGVIFSYGDPLPGTKEAWDALREAGHELVVVTDRIGLGGEAARSATWNWLFQHRLAPRDNTMKVYFSADKTSVQTDYFIDDKLENYDALNEAGVKVYLWDRPWNQDPSEGLPGGAWERRRVSSWDEFLEAVEGGEYLRVGAGRTFEPTAAQWEKLAEEESPILRTVPKDEWLDKVDVERVTSSTGGQKDKKLARLGSIDPLALMELAKVCGFGEQKYSRLNYMKGYDWSLSHDAGQRHRLAFQSGEDLDPESGLCHLAHAAWHDLCQLAFFLHNLGNDDRYKEDPQLDWVRDLMERNGDAA